MDEIIAALNSFDGRGEFYSKGEISFSDCDININRLGFIDFPIKKTQIEALIKIAKPAKFGWKDETILDESVRKVWEIPKSRVKISKRQWDDKFTPLLEDIKIDLGLPKESSLKAELHNMLIYEEGHFFKPHQDSEKQDNMIATLVIVLPTKYSGRELIIDHNGEKKSFVFKAAQLKKLSCIAFYSDCYHEVKKVKSSCRVTLTYNLILEKYKGDISILYEQDFYKKLERAVTNYFATDKKNSINKTPKNITYLLDHQYTQKSLSWDKLKNAYAGRVDALLKVTNDLGLEAHLALADMQETWECEFDYDSYRCSRRHYYDDEEDAEPDYIMQIEVELRNWIDRKGNKVDIKDFSPMDDEICWTGDNEDFEPFNSEYEGWMGNYGNTLDRWYHRAAIVLWQKKKRSSKKVKK